MNRLWGVLLVLSGLALAQSQPIDSLVRPQDRPGQLRYSLALRYAPLQTSGLGEEAERGIFAFTRVEHGLLLSGALELTLDATWKAFVGLSPEMVYFQTERRFAQELERLGGYELALGGLLGLEARLPGWGGLEPRVAIALGYPWALQYSLSLSLIRDPVVLVAQMSLNDALNERPTQLSFTLGTGFVANERISMQLAGELGLSLEPLILPSARLRLKTTYTLEARSEQQLASLLSLQVTGEQLRLGWGLELGGILR